jgi:hypothetical protein
MLRVCPFAWDEWVVYWNEKALVVAGKVVKDVTNGCIGITGLGINIVCPADIIEIPPTSDFSARLQKSCAVLSDYGLEVSVLRLIYYLEYSMSYTPICKMQGQAPISCSCPYAKDI